MPHPDSAKDSSVFAKGMSVHEKALEAKSAVRRY